MATFEHQKMLSQVRRDVDFTAEKAVWSLVTHAIRVFG